MGTHVLQHLLHSEVHFPWHNFVHSILTFQYHCRHLQKQHIDRVKYPTVLQVVRVLELYDIQERSDRSNHAHWSLDRFSQRVVRGRYRNNHMFFQ